MSAFVGFICVFLLGLASGVSFSHLLQRGPKRDLPPAEFVAVQRVLLATAEQRSARWKWQRCFRRWQVPSS